jgi:hypothetical protein
LTDGCLGLIDLAIQLLRVGEMVIQLEGRRRERLRSLGNSQPRFPKGQYLVTLIQCRKWMEERKSLFRKSWVAGRAEEPRLYQNDLSNFCSSVNLDVADKPFFA